VDKVTRDIIVVGASAGGVSPLMTLASKLPANFPAAIFVVLHVGKNRSVLPSLMTAKGPNAAHHAVDGEFIRPGHIYIAPPDRHLLLEKGVVRLSVGPKEHHARPAVDPLFRSAALHYGSRVIGVILSGRFDDGTAGMQAIKACGGLAIVQDPMDAEEESMSSSAIANVAIDHKVKADQLAQTLNELIYRPLPASLPPVDPRVQGEHDVSLSRGNTMQKLDNLGQPSRFGCPDCDGVLWEIADVKPQRFRCHTGHAYTLQTLAHTQATKSEDSLWAAVRALQEQTALLTQLAKSHKDSGDTTQANRYQHEANEVHLRSDILYRLITEPEAVSIGDGT
jgi:two-component system chemotaxis response regulator CheB